MIFVVLDYSFIINVNSLQEDPSSPQPRRDPQTRADQQNRLWNNRKQGREQSIRISCVSWTRKLQFQWIPSTNRA